jgi:ribosomal protein S18 acetylase RimI-like enzyme
MASQPGEQRARATVRLLRADDEDALVELRREALCAAPFAFKSSPEDDRLVAARKRGQRHVVRHLIEGDSAAIFGACVTDGDGERLVGMAGVRLDGKGKTAHKAHVWGVYVTAERRRAGLARALVLACIARARELGASTVRLSVSSTAPAARALYEALGFAAWGVEPDALRVHGESADEVHMALALDPDPAHGRILPR